MFLNVELEKETLLAIIFNSGLWDVNSRFMNKLFKNKISFEFNSNSMFEQPAIVLFMNLMF